MFSLTYHRSPVLDSDLTLLRSGEIRMICIKRAKVLRKRGEVVYWSTLLDSFVWIPRMVQSKRSRKIKAKVARAIRTMDQRIERNCMALLTGAPVA